MAARKKKSKKRGRLRAGGSSGKLTRLMARRAKRGRKKKKVGPTAFQKYLMRDPQGAKRKMGWK